MSDPGAMMLWLVSYGGGKDYEEYYSSAVIVAPDGAEARFVHPDGKRYWDQGAWRWKRTARLDYLAAGRTEIEIDQSEKRRDYWQWGSPTELKAVLIGMALPDAIAGTVVCYSFQAY